MSKDLFRIDHEFSWDQMYGGFLPRDSNPFRKARLAASTSDAALKAVAPASSTGLSAARSGTDPDAPRNDVDAISPRDARKR